MRFVLALCVLTAVACGGGTAATLTDRAKAADADGKILVVEFYTDWCRVCRKFEQTVLADPRVECAMKDVAFVRLDAERGGRAEADRLGVTAYPTFVILGPDGQPRARVRGSMTVDGFVSYLAKGQGLGGDDQMPRVCVAR